MKHFSVLLAALVSVAMSPAFGASSASINGALEFQLVDLDPNDSTEPYATLVSRQVYAYARLSGQYSWIDTGVFEQGPNGEAKVETLGDWAFSAYGRETREGGFEPGPGTSFEARVSFASDGVGMVLSPHTKLNLTATFSGNLAISPRVEEPAEARLWASVGLRAHDAVLPVQQPSAQFETSLSWLLAWETPDKPVLIPGQTSFASKVLSVSVVNSTDSDLPLEYFSTFYVTGISSIPEPSTWLLTLIGAVGLFFSQLKKPPAVRRLPRWLTRRVQAA